MKNPVIDIPIEPTRRVFGDQEAFQTSLPTVEQVRLTPWLKVWMWTFVISGISTVIVGNFTLGYLLLIPGLLSLFSIVAFFLVASSFTGPTRRAEVMTCDSLEVWVAGDKIAKIPWGDIKEVEKIRSDDGAVRIAWGEGWRDRVDLPVSIYGAPERNILLFHLPGRSREERVHLLALPAQELLKLKPLDEWRRRPFVKRED